VQRMARAARPHAARAGPGGTATGWKFCDGLGGHPPGGSDARQCRQRPLSAPPDRRCVAHHQLRVGNGGAAARHAMTGHLTASVVAQVARLLNGGGRPDGILAAVAEALRSTSDADRVEIWRQDPEAAGFYLVSAPA